MFSKSKIPQPDPEALYTPIVAHVSAHGSYSDGGRYRGSDKGVQANPGLFARVDLSDSEFRSIRSERFPNQQFPY